MDFDINAATFHCERLREHYVRFVHQSGLPVLLFPKQMHTVSAMMVVRYGAQDVRFSFDGRRYCRYPAGVAHYLEHQLFTREDGGTVDEDFSALGADVNAWTDYENTVYTVNTTDHAEQALEALLRFVTHPTFTEGSVQKERGIIAQEIRMVEDDPWEKLHRRAMSALYPHHSVTRSICGTERSVSCITPEMLYTCYRAFYHPGNMFLVVCGDIELSQLCGILDRVIKKADIAPPCVFRGSDGSYDKRIPVTHRTTGRGNVSKPIFEIVWRDDAYPSDAKGRVTKTLCMDVLSELLFSRAGVLYNRLIEAGLITPMYVYGYATMMRGAYHSISGESDDPEAVYALYKSTIEEFRRSGLASEDFERNRRVAYAGFVSDFDGTEEIAELMVDTESDGCGVFDRLAALDALTPNMVMNTFSSAFDEKHTALAVIYPNENDKEI